MATNLQSDTLYQWALYSYTEFLLLFFSLWYEHDNDKNRHQIIIFRIEKKPTNIFIENCKKTLLRMVAYIDIAII